MKELRGSSVKAVHHMDRRLESDADVDDMELVERLRSGESAACGELFLRHYRAVRAFIRARRPCDADDLAQTTFAILLEAKDRFRCDASVRTFLLGIANHQIMGQSRKSARDFSGLLLLADEPPTPLGELTAREGERLLVDSVARLPRQLRHVILLHYWQGMTAAQIAAKLGVPPGTVASRLRRARERLRSSFR